MQTQRVGHVGVRYVEHGSGRPVVVLHGAGVDHREPEACFDPVLASYGGLRRIYPDLPGMGRTHAPPEAVRSADDVLDVLVAFIDAVAGDTPPLVAGHSAGAYYALGIASRRPETVAGLALVCPLLPETRDVPPHRRVTGSHDIGDDGFRSYFVVQTPAMLERYQKYVVPGVALADPVATGRIGERWQLSAPTERGQQFPGPTLLVAGRQDSVVGYAATVDLLTHHAGSTLAILDGVGHALPHEQPTLLAALVTDWLDRCLTPSGR
jgi:pimeloyl-ACP methyl ester carboxylesterase